MLGKAKLPVRWKLKSPIKRTAKENGTAIEQQTHVPATSWGEMPEPEGPQERIPAPSLPRLSLLRAPSSPHRAQKHKRTRSTTAHSRSKEDPAFPEPIIPPDGVGQARSRFPLRGLQTLAKTFTRKGPGRRRRDPSEQESQPRETDEDDDTPSPQDSAGTEPVRAKDSTDVFPEDEVTGSLLRKGRHDAQDADDGNPREEESTLSCEVLDNHKDRLHGEDDAALREKMDDRRPPRIVFIGVFLNGIAVALASFVPAGGADARPLVKALLLQPSTPILPGGRYTACESTVAVHMVVDHKTRVYACVTADDVPLSLAFSLLEEVQIQYLFSVSTLAFSTAENAHTKRCLTQICQTWAKFERVERSLEKERETRRRLGEEPLDIEAPLSRDNKIDTGAEVVPLNFDLEHQSEALAATCDALMRASTESISGAPPAGTKKGLKVVVTSAAGGVVLLLAIWAVRSLYLTH